MSISKQVKYLREFGCCCFGTVRQAILEAADTIEYLSAKLQAENMDRSLEYCGGWILCKERLPEEKINPVTDDFYEYEVTFKQGNVTDVRHYKFGRGHWRNYGMILDDYVIAWREQLEPYHEP